ncbi:MAG: hypothetical protein U9Q69_02865 [Nanoarchaeota archaeon]|nr:hypothetical protein [Nanoarchaeota archaeon]
MKIFGGIKINASTLLSKTVNSATGALVEFYAKTKIAPPSKKEAKKIIKNLKERLREFENGITG